MSKITALHAQEILDSRGNPTIRVHLGLDGGVRVLGVRSVRGLNR